MAITVIRMLAVLLLIIATTFLIPSAFALYYGETIAIKAFLFPMLFVYVAAGLFLLIFRKKKNMRLSTRSGFAIVASGWITAGLLGAVPFLLSGTITNVFDAIFESVSGFTTTGATILSDVENLPKCINMWRVQMCWLGGMGIVALTVALMPLLGVGGFQLIKAETTGPEKGKITPKITMTAKLLWFIYLGMTVVQTILLLLCGMSFFDALAHSFSTLGTGGFSTRNASIGHYNSAAIDWVCITFMALAGVNFSLYYQVLIGKGREMLENTEFKVYVSILFVCTLAITFIIMPLYNNFFSALRFSAFQAVSITTTTGLGTADFDKWPAAAQMIIFSLMFIGGSSGSTSGGVKVVRWVVMSKQASNEIRRMIHPHGIFSIRLNGRAGRKDIVFNVTSFMLVYFILLAITTFVASCGGADLFSAFTASLALVGNVGPGFAMVGPTQNYGFFADAAKLWFSFAMLAGRLELYTMIIFFFPVYWRK